MLPAITSGRHFRYESPKRLTRTNAPEPPPSVPQFQAANRHCFLAVLNVSDNPGVLAFLDDRFGVGLRQRRDKFGPASTFFFLGCPRPGSLGHHSSKNVGEKA